MRISYFTYVLETFVSATGKNTEALPMEAQKVKHPKLYEVLLG